MSSLHSGEIFAGRFQIDRTVGSGGMGTVYRARDQLSGDFVALKLLQAPGPDRGDNERFEREAQILAELRHPGIVGHAAHGVSDDGQRFLAMQWLEGEDLSQRLARRPLSIGDALTLTERVAQALAFAHQRGIIHRDLKPSNLFLPGGHIERVQILDFGIARRLAASRAMTRSGVIIGTPEYMAPEQARGVRELTPAVDLFSLGCVLYECLAGDPPFVADHIAAVLVRILFEAPAPIAQRRPGTPTAVSELIGRLLAKDPRQRLADASEVAAVIARVGEFEEVPLSPTLPAGGRATPPQPDSEQVLLSLVLALHSRDAAGSGSTVLPADVQNELERHGTLLAELRAIGTQADFLLGGALVVTVPQMSSANDQAAMAAHCAAKVKELWPEAQVVVVTGRGSRSRGGLTGEVLDRAWRLLGQPAAPPNAGSSTQIRIDEVTAGLLESRFELSPLPALASTYALGRERLDPDAGRLLLGKPTPCVGRDRELSMLDALYTECQEEQLARAVLVMAPTGLGKSRLRHEFLRRLHSRDEGPIVLFGRGDPLMTRSAYGLLGGALRQQLELRAGQDLAEQRTRLRERIHAALPAAAAARVTVFLGEICGVPFPEEESPMLKAARQDPRIMADQVEQAWLDGLQMFLGKGPLLVVLEDLHWSDPLTVKLVDAALRRLRNQALLVLALSRPEVLELYPNLWAGALQPLPLRPLAPKAGERLVRQILSSDVAPEQIERIVAQSAGNPLYLEELIRAAAEHKTAEIPDTVAAMIQARIGRLPHGTRRALRAASVFGETFWETGLRSLVVASHGEEGVESALAELVREEIVERTAESRFAEQRQYRFRHALVRGAAYGLVSPEEESTWHAAAGAFLQTAGEREAIVLAEHFRLGQEMARAQAAYVKATEQAHDAGDMDTALICVERGLECGATGEDRGVLLSFECEIRIWRLQYDRVLTAGPAALVLLRHGSKPASRVLYAMFLASLLVCQSKLPELVEQFLGVEPEPEGQALHFISATMLVCILITAAQVKPADLLRNRVYSLKKAIMTHDHNAWAHFFHMELFYIYYQTDLPYTALKHAQKVIQAAEQAGNRQIQSAAHSFLGKFLGELGQIDEGLQVLRTNLAFTERLEDSLPLSYCYVILAYLLAMTQLPRNWDEAENLAHKTIATNNPDAIALANLVLAQIAMNRGHAEVAESMLNAAFQRQKYFPNYKADSAALWSKLLVNQGKVSEAIRLGEQVFQEIREFGIKPRGRLALYVVLAEARSRAGLEAEARQAVEQALTVLRSGIADISDADTRATYLRNIPENVQLLKLAEKWSIDLADLKGSSTISS